MHVLKEIGKWIRDNGDMPAVFFSVFYIEILIRYFMGFGSLNGQIILFDCALAVFLCALMIPMGRKIRFVFDLIVFALLGLIAMAQVWHYIYFSTFFSFAKAAMLSEFATVKGEAAGKFNWNLLWFYLPVFLFIVTFLFSKNRQPGKRSFRWLICVLCAALGVSLMGYTTTTYAEAENKNESDQYLYSTLYNKLQAVEKFGFFSYEIRDLDLTLLGGSSYTAQENDPNAGLSDEEIVDKYLEENPYEANETSYSGMFEGKNLVLVLCESFSPGAISEELTPTLYMMSTEGINFTNNYSPVYQTATCDSEFISLTGMIPSVTDMPIAYNYYGNSYPGALANLLNAMGYSSNSFHAYYGGFYNRDKLHQQYGFRQLYDWNAFDYSAEKHDDFIEAYNWIHDKYLAINMVKTDVENNEYPFFNFMISVTGHMPYNRYRYELEGDLYKAFEVYGEPGEKYSEELLCYFAAQESLDDAMAQMILDFDNAGLLDDTVFILYGDHYPYGLSDDALKEYYGSSYKQVEMYQTPFFIWTPGIEGKQVTEVTSTYDIYPTICNLFNIDIDGEFIVGRDALDSSKKGTVIFSDYSWLSDDAYYDATAQTVTKYSDTVTDEEIQAKTEQVFDEIEVSQKILELNYYADSAEASASPETSQSAEASASSVPSQ